MRSLRLAAVAGLVLAAAAGAGRDHVAGLSAMFANEIVMPVTGQKFARGAAAAAEALRADRDNDGDRAEWTPIRGGISADGQHGFTFGYMTITRADGTRQPAKYLSYWIRKPEGWRVAVYRRSRADAAPASRNMMSPSLPVRLVPVSINLGPPSEPAVTVGAEAIGRAVGSAYPSNEPPVTWAPDAVIVASSGDLGVTIGMITPNRPRPDGKSAPPIPFFTIWRRASVADPWRYIAE